MAGEGSAAPRLVAGINLPFAEQIDFFRRKLNLPTERWDDIKRAAHDRAFVVAGAMKADLLADLREAVAPLQRTSQAEFDKQFRQIVKAHGWHGWTGEGTEAGEAWRTRVIYETNVRTSYAAGRWRQLTDPAMLAERPYWRYVHSGRAKDPRPQHLHWSAIRLTLRYDHPFWKTNFPPNDFGCGCRVVAERAPAGDVATAPPEGWDKINPKTGAPVGIGKGWDYAPGANADTALADLVAQKLLALDAPVGATMWAHLGPAVAMEQRLALADMVDAAAEALRPSGQAALAHVATPATVADLARRGVPLETADIWLRDEELVHALRDAKGERGAALSLQTWRDLPALLAAATPYLDLADTALVYAFDTEDGLGKVLVRVNYRDKLRVGGKRTKLTSNFIRTGGLVEARNLKESRYVELQR